MTIAALSWSALRPLRPVLLAGAAAVAWLAVSAPAADADNSHRSDSLGGSISSAVSSVKGTADGLAGGVGALVSSEAHEARDAAEPTPAIAPPPLPAVDPAAIPALPGTAVPLPAEQPPVIAPPDTAPAPSAPVVTTPVDTVAPDVADVGEPIDAALGGLPLGEAIPGDTLAGVTDPVAPVVDGALTDTAETIVQPVVEVVKPVAEVVQPVTDVLPVEPITDALVPPLTAPITPVTDILADAVTNPALLPSANLADTGLISTRSGATTGIVAEPSGMSAPPVQTAVGSPAYSSHSVALKAAAPAGSAPKVPTGGDSPSRGDRTPTPEALLPAPASGSGSGASSGSPSASAAWLNSPFEYLPLMGFVPVSGPLQHVPSPVAIDPGSSPD